MQPINTIDEESAEFLSAITCSKGAVATLLAILLVAAVVAPVQGASLKGGNHSPISITSDFGFTSVGSAIGCACVSDGTGSSSDPFEIGPWTIMATSSGPGVLISGVTKFFAMSHLTIHGTGVNDGIDLVNLNAVGPSGEHLDSITAVNIDGARNGIALAQVAGVSISGNSLNNNRAWGIRLLNSHDNTITFMTISHNGLLNPDSTELPESAGAFLQNEFFGGVLFMDSDHNTLSRSQLSEDAYAGFVLVRSDFNTVFDINSRYPDYFGGVLQDSSSNVLNRIDMQTADFDGLVIRGGGSNTVEFSDFSANGPIGNELKAHVVPYFVAGIYLGWGTHDNHIVFDHANRGNTGPSLVVDDGSIVNPVQTPLQDQNPFNGAGGNDPGTVPAVSAFDPGAGTAAGAGNVYCGNSFVSFTGPTDPNDSC